MQDTHHSYDNFPSKRRGSLKKRAGRVLGAIACACMLASPMAALASEEATDTTNLVAQDYYGTYGTYYDPYSGTYGGTYYDPYTGTYGESYYNPYTGTYGESYYNPYTGTYSSYPYTTYNNYNTYNTYSTNRSNSSSSYNISNASVTLDTKTYTYTGQEIKPKPIVRVSTSSTTYSSSWDLYGNYYWNYNNGVWYIDIDNDAYHDDYYTVLYDSYTDSYYYLDNGRTYTVTLPYSVSTNSNSGRTLTEGTDYYLTYSNNINVGTATITVHGKNSYYGSKDITFTITNSSGKYVRLSGATRYDTMSAIVSEAFPGRSNVAIVACGNNFPDALAASSLAGIYNAPVILTDSTSLAAQARHQLTSLAVNTVYLMGGTSALSPTVETELRDMGIAVNRIAGVDRIGTSLRAMEATKAAGNASNTVIIATGYNYADTLSIGPWAYQSRSPIVLTTSNGTLTQEAVDAIKADPTKSNIIIVGGTAVVSEYVRDQLGSAYTYTRLAGSNRYETSREIANWETSHGLNWMRPSLATGNNFPDALAGAPLAGSKGSVLLLVSSANDATVSAIITNARAITNFYVLGGEAALSNALVTNITNRI